MHVRSQLLGGRVSDYCTKYQVLFIVENEMSRLLYKVLYRGRGAPLPARVPPPPLKLSLVMVLIFEDKACLLGCYGE